MKNSIEEDRHLINQCLDGDTDALEEFISQYSPLVYRYVQQTFVANNTSFEEDDIMEHHNSVFVHLLENQCRKLTQFKGINGCSLASWIRLLTCRVVMNKLREDTVDAAWFGYCVPLEEAADVIFEELGALETMETEERKLFVRNCFQKLNARDRLFLKLHVEQDLPIPKVAVIMQIPVANAHTLRYRSFERLKRQIEDSLKEKY